MRFSIALIALVFIRSGGAIVVPEATNDCATAVEVFYTKSDTLRNQLEFADTRNPQFQLGLTLTEDQKINMNKARIHASFIYYKCLAIIRQKYVILPDQQAEITNLVATLLKYLNSAREKTPQHAAVNRRITESIAMAKEVFEAEKTMYKFCLPEVQK